jgi:hypothetical protein
MNKIVKNLSTGEYYAQIQREYLIAEFRRKIYYSLKNKKYYERVMKYKQEKINDISQRNNLNSIFNDESLMHEIKKEIFGYHNIPLFRMTDDDMLNYYSKGAEFSFAGKVWKLEQMDMHGDLLLKNSNNETTIVHRDCTFRII